MLGFSIDLKHLKSLFYSQSKCNLFHYSLVINSFPSYYPSFAIIDANLANVLADEKIGDDEELS